MQRYIKKLIYQRIILLFCVAMYKDSTISTEARISPTREKFFRRAESLTAYSSAYGLPQ